MVYIGQSSLRVDAQSKVNGQAQFASDINRPNQAYMKILFSSRPHAIVKSVCTAKAEQVAGVLAVLTAKDVPVNEFGYYVYDQPVLCGPGSAKPYTDRVRFPGDKIALVIAESEEIAARARSLIEVEYEDLPLVTDPEQAMLPEAIVLHPDFGSNLFEHRKIRKGNVDQAFKEADVIIEGVYQTPAQEHAFLNTESGVSFIDDEGRVSMIVTGQWAHKDRTKIAHALALGEEQVRVVYPVIGGAFGGREDIGVQIVLGLAALKLHERGISRPVKVVLTREESTYDHCKRHPFKFYCRWAAMKDGKVTAAEVKLIADGGAYLFTTPVVSGVTNLNCTGPYDIPNIKVDSYDVYTNAVPRGAMRGFGGPQGAYAAEMQMNKLAEALGIDPVELRMRNIIEEGTIMSTGSPFPASVNMRETLKECALMAGWEEGEQGWQRKAGWTCVVPGKPHLRRGLGIGCSYKNAGFGTGFQEYCWVTLELYGGVDIDTAIIRHTATEVGQGTYTVIRQMAAEALQVPLERVQVMDPDTSQSNDSGAVSASRMTFMIGNAIREAAALALDSWNSEERPVKITHQYLAPATTAPDPETGACDPMVSFAYTAEAVEIELDMETGHTEIVRVVCANDIGKAINPVQVEAQLQGGLVQSIGYALLENYIEKDGFVRTPNFSTYLIPTVLDIPDRMDINIIETPDPRGPWGARGVGEMPLLPFAPAVGGALHDASGLWHNDFPFVAERVWRTLSRNER
ncbi:MAG: xanthine dehydrogenase family protein molybdopterin-binding subunit [Anaerolineaceae bacterium]|nr:xanthine dehydrogenase family protein molybdopterin-binding subunit [Anaerolineaceae bacterium]